MLFHLGGMFGAGKGCQLQNFSNLSLQYVRGEVMGFPGGCFDRNEKCQMPVLFF